MVPGGCTTLLYSFKCKGNNLPVNTAAASTATTSVGAVRTPRRQVGRGTHITARATTLPPGRMSILCLSVCIDIKFVSHN